jgi:alkylated DNA repair dioxygenase AlkB
MGSSQLRLFAGAKPTIDTGFATARRIHLDPFSWVDYVPNWLSDDEQLFESLLGVARWEQRDRWMFDRMVREPRMTAEYPVLSEAPVPLLREIGAALSEHYRIPYDGLWMNLYRDHRDSTSWHGDRPSCKRDECIVPVLSLGAPRRFLIRSRQGGKSAVFNPAGGDLIVMGGRCQKDWLHAVPKQSQPAGARISVNFQSMLQATREPAR